MKGTSMAEGFAYEQATSYRRLAARFIDLIVVWLFVIMPIGFPISAGLTYIFKGNDDGSTLAGLIMVCLCLLLPLAYDTVLVSLWGKTPGKALLGMMVTDIHGERLGWKNSLTRVVVMYLVGLGVLLLIVITASLLGWIFLSGLGKYQRFPHDRSAKSFVVRVKGGQLVEAALTPEAHKAVPELAALRDQGIISEEEYQRKLKELGD